MTRDEAIAEIREGLSFNSRLDESIVISALKTAQRMLEKEAELPWFLGVFEHPLVTVTDTPTVTLPANFLRDTETGTLFVVNDEGYPGRNEVFKTPFYQDVDFDRDGEDEGYPVYYKLEVSDIRLYPTPDKVYNLRLNYFKKDDVLTTNVENLWLKHAPDLLIGYAGQVVCMKTKDSKSYQTFSAMRAEAQSILTRETIARRETGVQYQMGGPH